MIANDKIKFHIESMIVSQKIINSYKMTKVVNHKDALLEECNSYEKYLEIYLFLLHNRNIFCMTDNKS